MSHCRVQRVAALYEPLVVRPFLPSFFLLSPIVASSVRKRRDFPVLSQKSGRCFSATATSSAPGSRVAEE